MYVITDEVNLIMASYSSGYKYSMLYLKLFLTGSGSSPICHYFYNNNNNNNNNN